MVIDSLSLKLNKSFIGKVRLDKKCKAITHSETRNLRQLNYSIERLLVMGIKSKFLENLPNPDLKIRDLGSSLQISVF